MPRRPPKSGYARIAQAEEAEEEEEEEQRPYSDSEEDRYTNNLSSPTPEYAPIQPRRHQPMRLPEDADGHRRPRRRRTNSGVDIKAINARLERWADEIKDRFTRRRVKGKSSDEERLEIHHTVFTAPDWIRPATKEAMNADYDDGAQRMSKMEFDDLVESVRTAIELGMHPTLILQGSSGSYFARNSGGKVLGVFKPKDEEPYANKNPKWTKWLHRNLLPFAFGRAMLIPNLSYVSEAAAYVLDCQLRTNIVPYTGVIGLSSQSFHYDWIDRRAFRKKHRPFPEKLGSFQVFLKGYKGATDFLREQPWPDHHTPSGFRDAPSQKRRRKRWDESCRPGNATDLPDGSEDEGESLAAEQQQRDPSEFWTPELQQSFREELEKLVILDYIMRNTDRGTDNWMIRVDREAQQATIVKEPPQLNGTSQAGDGYYRREESMTAARPAQKGAARPKLGAIDNSLSWPWKHPDAWRSYPFGWLFLPVSLIGKPFAEKTRRHFLPLLTSKEWWSETQVKLRRCFEIDADFQEKMYARQIAVMKGQAWNVVEALKTPDHGPLELTRRHRVLVWDDLVDIPVAVHLPRASEEMRKSAAESAVVTPSKDAEAAEEEEEMDISAAHASTTTQPIDDLLGISAPDKADKNPFNHSRQNSTQDVPRPAFPDTTNEAPSTPPIGAGSKELKFSLATPNSAPGAARPGAYRSRTGGPRVSHDVPRSMPWQSPSAERRRRFSFTVRRDTFGSGGGLDDEGDLGYAAAATQESSMRKVIVERLEMVKAKTPFFSWC